MLNADELKHGPGPRLAFLASLDPQVIAEVMVAFANTEGGIFVLGMQADGQPVTGTMISEAGVQKALETAENLFNPGIVIEDWKELELEDTDSADNDPLGRVVIMANETPQPLETAARSSEAASAQSEKAPDAAPPVTSSEGAKPDSAALDMPAPQSAVVAIPLDTDASPILMSTDGSAKEGDKVVETPESVAAAETKIDSPETKSDAETAAAATPTPTGETALSTPASAETTVKTESDAETPVAEASIAEAVEKVIKKLSTATASDAAPESAEIPVSTDKVIAPKPEASPVYAVRIPRSIELHALNDGRVLIRSGARNRPLGGQEILRLASAKGTGEFEAEVVPGATQADFSRRLIDEYLTKRAERTKRPFSGSIDDMLLEIGALTSDRRPTTAGILLFSEYPQKWLPQSSMIFARFVGTQPRGESGMAGYIRREEITGPLPRLIEAAWNLVWSEMAVSAVVSGLERVEKIEYPQFAVREAIVNSICHRDYRLRGRRIELRMYSDRLEVISPGGLPGFITVENIKDEHFSRNPRIVNGLFQWGYIEELGLGIDRMIEVMEQAGREPPRFDARPYSFAVTLNNEREKQRPLDWIRSANHRQARAMQYIREHGSITNREYRILCAGVSAETLRLDLAGMVDRGQLIKMGSKKGTHYILRDKDAPDLQID